MFTGIGSFEGTFFLYVKDDVKPYQALPRHVAYALQEPFKKAGKTSTTDNDITGDKTVEWCNSFVIVPKPNGKVCLCLHPM